MNYDVRMDQNLIQLGDRLSFQPWPNTVGWTVERHRSLGFKYRDLPPQDFQGKQVVVISFAMDENSYRVHFVEDLPCDYFYCCAMMLEPIGTCICSNFDLFNFGCKCGAVKN
jgi:hypothetical protein